MEPNKNNNPTEPPKSQLNYLEIKIPNYKVTRINSAPLSSLDFARFKVGCKLKRRSLSSNAQSALTMYILRCWEEDEKRLIVEANRLEITPEELFNRLANDDIEE